MAKRRRRESSTEESPKNRRRRTSETSTKKTNSKGGWSKLSQRAAEAEANAASSLPEFWLKDEEYSHIQLLHDEPYVYDAVNVQIGGNWQTLVSQLEVQDHCLLIQSGHKPSTKAAWLILDFRGSWNKDDKEFEWDKPKLKVLTASLTLAQQIQKYKDRSKKPLVESVIEIQRSGSGKQTAYNLSKAFDEEEELPVKAVEYNETLPEITEVIKPKSDEELIRLGFGPSSKDEDEEY